MMKNPLSHKSSCLPSLCSAMALAGLADYGSSSDEEEEEKKEEVMKKDSSPPKVSVSK